MTLAKRVRFLLTALVVTLLHNVIHEGIHCAAAIALGEGVDEFRLLTNGWLTSQVVFSTPVVERSGAHWLAISWLPTLVTSAIGFLIYLSRKRLIGSNTWLNTFWWYAGFFFLFIDPFYFAVLSLFLGGDIQAAAAVNWSEWPVRVVALGVLAAGMSFMWHWRQEAKRSPDMY